MLARVRGATARIGRAVLRADGKLGLVHDVMWRFIACMRRIRVIRLVPRASQTCASNPKATSDLRNHKERQTASYHTVLVPHAETGEL